MINQATSATAKQAVQDERKTSGAAQRPRSGLRGRYLQLKRRLRQFNRFSKWLLKIGLNLAAIVVATVVAVSLVTDLTSDRIEIQPIAVPKTMDEDGYSPEVAALQLQDAVNAIAMDAASAGAQGLTVSKRSETPEVLVPTIGVSTSMLSAYLQRFFGYSRRTMITGEITKSDDGLRLLLRLNGQVIFRSHDAVAADHLDQLWAPAAHAVIWVISPYREAFALYDEEPERAMSLAESIIHRYPGSDENVAWANILRGIHDLDSLQYPQAEKDFRKVLDQATERHPMLSWMQFVKLGPYAAAMPRWRPLEGDVSYAELAHLYLGLTLLQKSQNAAAAVELRKAIQIDPDDPAAHHYLGLVLKNLEQNAEADAEFTAAREIFMRTFTLRADAEGRGPASAQLHVSFGNALLQETGIAELEERQIDDALAQFRWAVEVDPNSDYTYRSICYALLEAQNFDSALTACQQAVEKAPSRVQNHLMLALVLVERGDLDRAREVADTAFKLAPSSPLVHQIRGAVHEASGDRAWSRKEYTRADAEFEGARAEYQAAVRRAPQSADFRKELGAVLGKQGDVLRARAGWAEQDEDFANAQRLLARAYQKLTNAAVQYRKAIELAPDDMEGRASLAKVMVDQNSVVDRIFSGQ